MPLSGTSGTVIDIEADEGKRHISCRAAAAFSFRHKALVLIGRPNWVNLSHSAFRLSRHGLSIIDPEHGEWRYQLSLLHVALIWLLCRLNKLTIFRYVPEPRALEQFDGSEPVEQWIVQQPLLTEQRFQLSLQGCRYDHDGNLNLWQPNGLNLYDRLRGPDDYGVVGVQDFAFSGMYQIADRQASQVRHVPSVQPENKDPSEPEDLLSLYEPRPEPCPINIDSSGYQGLHSDMGAFELNKTNGTISVISLQAMPRTGTVKITANAQYVSFAFDEQDASWAYRIPYRQSRALALQLISGTPLQLKQMIAVDKQSTQSVLSKLHHQALSQYWQQHDLGKGVPDGHSAKTYGEYMMQDTDFAYPSSLKRAIADQQMPDIIRQEISFVFSPLNTNSFGLF